MDEHTKKRFKAAVQFTLMVCVFCGVLIVMGIVQTQAGIAVP